jgi:hypothetical protein
MKPPALLIAVLLAVLVSGSDVLAWAPETRMRMVEDALKLMPRSLRTVLRSHEAEILRGALEPLTEEGTAPHLPPSVSGTLPGEIARRSQAVIAAVEEQKSFSEVARRFGALSHFVADAGFPPAAGGKDGAGRYGHFSDLVKSRHPKIRFVFYGHEDEDLERDDLEAFTLRILERAARQDAELARTYSVAGDPPNPALFDDRSVPFAVASLAYSKTVTDIVRSWLDAWERAHGDMGRTPYLKRNRQGKRSEP